MVKKWMILTIAVCTMLTADTTTLQAKIAQLQTLPKTERFKLMNEIKRELARMNETQRKEALGRLRASMQGRGRGSQHGIQQHQGIQEHLHQNQNIPQQQMHEQAPAQSQPRPQIPQNRPENQHNRPQK